MRQMTAPNFSAQFSTSNDALIAPSFIGRLPNLSGTGRQTGRVHGWMHTPRYTTPRRTNFKDFYSCFHLQEQHPRKTGAAVSTVGRLVICHRLMHQSEIVVAPHRDLKQWTQRTQAGDPSAKPFLVSGSEYNSNPIEWSEWVRKGLQNLLRRAKPMSGEL